jgi:transcriptional regulator with XRE-family HTH domain
MQAEEITIADVSAKLRALRRARGWSLMDVEIMSEGRLKAVVLGSYERGSRTLSVKRALEILELYGVPASQLFTEKKTFDSPSDTRRMLDLRTINRRAQVEGPWRERFLLIARFTRSILESRQDWNGEVLSLRTEDSKIIALILDINKAELLRWLDDEKVLVATR